ncbi:metallophosphoesterase family protein [Candidatus Roizmanbacteria bacterium]|nr:metallophosphoesterase family protein [Candidatus Roizmanbacteria bacterium]
MKLLVLSDTHLDLPFEEKKFKFLKKIISTADRVIINGDFWEGYNINFKQFINSPWKNLFSLLRSKKTIYLYGNHDRKHYSNKQTFLFSILQTQQYKMRLNGKTLVFEHGNRLMPLIDETHPNVFNLIKKTNILGFIHKELVRKSGSKFFRHFLNMQNKAIKKRIKQELKNNEIFICGHTHSAEFDLKNNFINTGFIKYGLAQYLIVDSHKLTPKEEWYD